MEQHKSLSAASPLDPDLSAYASERAVRCVQPIAHAKITRKDVAIVVYHHIGDGKEELVKNLGLSILPETFEKQISYFKTNYDFVGASDLVSGILPRRAVHVTFDDAYRSVLQVAGPVLKAASAPSTFFVCPSILTSDFLPIENILSLAQEELGWERMLSLVQVSNRITSISQLLLKVISQMSTTQLAATRARLFSALGTTEAEIRRATSLFLSPAEIKDVSKLRMEIGNHSLHHVFFRSLSTNELHKEIVEGRTILQDLCGQSVPYLSIPYGNKLDATKPAVELARASGHKAIFLVHGKSNRFPEAPDIFYRSPLGHAGAPSALAFQLKFMPLARSLRDGLEGLGI